MSAMRDNWGGIWLYHEDDLWEILILGDDNIQMNEPDHETVHRLANSDQVVIVRQVRRGRSGRITGLLAGGVHPSHPTAVTLRDLFRTAITTDFAKCRLRFGTEDFAVAIANAPDPVTLPTEEIIYEVSFDFYERPGE